MSNVEKQKFFIIMSMAIMSLLCLIGTIVGLIIYINEKNNVVEPIYPSWWTKPSTSKKESENYILPAGLGGMTFLFNFISSLLILCFKWDTKWCNENKKLWGLLSMFIVFAIGEIIFCSIGIYKAKKSPKDNILDKYRSTNERHDLNNFVDDY